MQFCDPHTWQVKAGRPEIWDTPPTEQTVNQPWLQKTLSQMQNNHNKSRCFIHFSGDYELSFFFPFQMRDRDLEMEVGVALFLSLDILVSYCGCLLMLLSSRNLKKPKFWIFKKGKLYKNSFSEFSCFIFHAFFLVYSWIMPISIHLPPSTTGLRVDKFETCTNTAKSSKCKIVDVVSKTEEVHEEMFKYLVFKYIILPSIIKY